MKIKRRKELTANVGILAVGHHAYWAQFDGLLDKLNNKLDIFKRKVKSHGVNVAGDIDVPIVLVALQPLAAMDYAGACAPASSFTLPRRTRSRRRNYKTEK